jgi:hypothetical protein
MGRPRIVEINYHVFESALRTAAAEGTRLEPTEKVRWAQWVKENAVKEAAFRSYCKGQYEQLKAVILDQEGPWKGYYLMSSVEEVCLKWDREADS